MVDSKSYAVRYQDKVRVVRSNVPPLSYISEVPEEISPSDYPFLKVSENDQGLTVIVDLESKHLFQMQDEKASLKESILSEYLKDVDDEMYRVFGTTSRDAANSMFLTWQMMLSNPGNYAPAGLLDGNGLALDTQSKVSAYARGKVEMVESYSVFLIKRREQYLAKKKEAL